MLKATSPEPKERVPAGWPVPPSALTVREVRELSGFSPNKKKPIDASAIAFALLFGLPLSYWTFTIVKDGFSIWALFDWSACRTRRSP